MEGYIKRINDKITKKYDKEKQKKIKKGYLISGSVTLSIGLLGILSSFIAFVVLFIKFDTDKALVAWFVAIPFILMVVIGSVFTRIGDMLLKDESQNNENLTSIDNSHIDNKRIKKDKKTKSVDDNVSKE